MKKYEQAKSLWVTAMAVLVFFFFDACTQKETSSEVFDGAKDKTQTNTQDKRMSDAFYKNLALRWAPIHYQDVDNAGCGALNGRADYITAINFDNDYVSTNNWNNIDPSRGFSPTGHCYYSVAETSTHFFVVYSFFHPRDWANVCIFGIDYHENDLEGELSIIKKSSANNGYGELQGMVTVAHSDFYSFVPSGSPLQANQESIDGPLSFESFNGELHPITAQESKGHGLKAWPAYQIVGGDGLKYFPSATIAEAPANNNDRDVKYKLVHVFEPNGFWDRRFNTQFLTNAKSFPSTQGTGGANAPWNWDDGNDTPGVGEISTDPARLTSFYFKNLGSFSTTYLYNPYKGIF